MTPKEKAEELVDKMYNVDINDSYDERAMQYQHATRCALIAVDEIINNDGFTRHDDSLTEYWNQVKQEIENI